MDPYVETKTTYASLAMQMQQTINLLMASTKVIRTPAFPDLILALAQVTTVLKRAMEELPDDGR